MHDLSVKTLHFGIRRENEVTMRKSRQEAAETRRRIVKTAAEEFRTKGISETGLSELMAAAGLTPGGFYRHFDSKGQLIAESCDHASDEAIQMTREAAAESGVSDGLAAIIESYLSTEHRDNRGDGCPFAALGSELVRGEKRTRTAATQGFLRFAELIAEHMDGAKPSVARTRAMVVLSSMIGALTMARMVNDPALSVAILRHTRKHLMLN